MEIVSVFCYLLNFLTSFWDFKMVHGCTCIFSFESMFWNIFQFALLVQFFGSLSCAFTGVHRFPRLNLCFGECRFSVCWFNFLIFFLGSRV